MSNFTTLFQSIVRTIKSLINQILPQQSKPTLKFYLDMIFGIMKSNSLVLNDIAHALNETTQLKKVNYRLQRNLEKEPDVFIKHQLINVCLQYMNSEHYTFLVDDSDIVKPYGKKFENLALVRDGSSLNHSYVTGYRVTSIVGITKNYKHPICLYTKIHNATEKNYKSTNHVTNQGIQMIIDHLKINTSTFIFDRGYDDQKLMNLIHDSSQYFIIRVKNNRVIKKKNYKTTIFSEAKRRKGKINIPYKLKGQNITIKVSHIEGYINQFKNKVTIAFSYLNDSTEPMILISNHKINQKEDLIRIVLGYVSRWKIEEHFRFKKVQFGLENFRVKSLTSINHLCLILDLVLLVFAHFVETQKRNIIFSSLIQLSKKIRDDVYIYYYQLASGIKALFTSNKMGVKNYKETEKWEYQRATLFNSLELKCPKRVRKKKV
jgi:hypothetical protein